MSIYDQSRGVRTEAGGEAKRDGAAPGKRTLTQGLARRAVTTFDPTSEYMESRATIDGPPRLPAHQLRRARRKNPRWQRKLGFDPAAWSDAPVDSDEFANDVAAKQTRAGLRPDGIVGPETAATASPAREPAPKSPPAAGRPTRGPDGAPHRRPVEQFDPSAQYMESRATIDGPPPGDDPFGLHLLGS